MGGDMVEYFIVECPCRKVDKHTHRISNPDVIKFVISLPTNQKFPKKVEKTDEEDVKIFYYECDYSKHECKVWIDIETGKQKGGECTDCN